MENKKPRLDPAPPASSSSNLATAVENDNAELEGLLELGRQGENMSRFQDFCTNYMLASLYPVATNDNTGHPVNQVAFVIGTFTSLGMILVGAKGKTRSAIASEMGVFGMCRPDLDAALSDLFQSLRELPLYEAELTLSTRLAVDDKYHVLEDFFPAVKRAGLPMSSVFTCEMECKTDRKSMAEEIHNWINRVTNGGVPRGGISMPPKTKLVVMTAGLVSDSWKFPMTAGSSLFRQIAGGPEYLVNSVTTNATLSMMEIFAGEQNRCQAIVIPFKSPNLDFVIFNTTGEVCIALAFNKILAKRSLLDMVYGESKEVKAKLTFPIFDVATEMSVKNTLCKINLDAIFDQGADLSGMLNTKDVGLTEMLGIAKVQVDRNGINCSGSVSARGRASGSRTSSQDVQGCDENTVKIEKPFGFMLVAHRKIPLYGGMIFSPQKTGEVQPDAGD